MRKNKLENNGEKSVIKGETSGSDRAALACDLLILVISLWNQIRYGMDMLFLIVPLSLIGAYLATYAFLPEMYCFTEGSLEIAHKFRKKITIPYELVFHYDAVAHDSFVNLLRSNTVKVYYIVNGKKRVAVCKPCQVGRFTELLKMRCPEFWTDKQDLSRLEVFFGSEE